MMEHDEAELNRQHEESLKRLKTVNVKSILKNKKRVHKVSEGLNTQE